MRNGELGGSWNGGGWEAEGRWRRCGVEVEGVWGAGWMGADCEWRESGWEAEGVWIADAPKGFSDFIAGRVCVHRKLFVILPPFYGTTQ